MERKKGGFQRGRKWVLRTQKKTRNNTNKSPSGQLWALGPGLVGAQLVGASSASLLKKLDCFILHHHQARATPPPVAASRDDEEIFEIDHMIIL